MQGLYFPLKTHLQLKPSYAHDNRYIRSIIYLSYFSLTPSPSFAPFSQIALSVFFQIKTAFFPF